MTHSFPPRRSSDIAEILSKKPEAINDYHDPVWPSKEQAGSFFWSEPLFGYYLDTDRWVLYKHAEMLADAGVDMIMFDCTNGDLTWRSEEHTSELQSLMRISYAVFCLKKKNAIQ